MPLDAACYVPTVTPYIAAVRGPYFYKLNATTGVKISAQVFDPRLVNGPSTIAYDPVTSTLIAGGVYDNDNLIAPLAYYGARSIWRINPTTLACTEYNIESIYRTFTASKLNRTQDTVCGLLGVICDGTYVWMLLRVPYTSASSCGGGIFACDPTTLAILNGRENVLVPRINGHCVISNVAYGCDVTWPRVYGRSFVLTAPYLPKYGSAGPLVDISSWGSPIYPIAICYSSVASALYITGTSMAVFNDGSAIGKANPTTGAFISALNTGRAAFNGVSIKVNPYTGLIYAAGAGDNTVIVIDPSTDALTVKTGFDFPIDLVFTPTKTFAVQAGSKGLLQVV